MAKVQVINRREIRFSGIRRSGNHAVISWLMHNHQGLIIHCNNITKRSLDPFSAYEQIEIKGTDYSLARKDLLGRLKYRVRRAIFPDRLTIFYSRDFRIDREWIRDITPKDLLVLSYENRFLKDVYSDEFEYKRTEFLGESDERFDILLLRDPYNLFASMLVSNRLNVVNQDHIINLWKEHAREFAGQTKILGSNRVLINFNEWCSSGDYRQRILEKFEINGDAGSFQAVPIYGGGSSFEGTSADGKATEMKVLERWRLVEYNEDFKNIFKDHEILELATEIFGKGPILS